MLEEGHGCMGRSVLLGPQAPGLHRESLGICWILDSAMVTFLYPEQEPANKG